MSLYDLFKIWPLASVYRVFKLNRGLVFVWIWTVVFGLPIIKPLLFTCSYLRFTFLHLPLARIYDVTYERAHVVPCIITKLSVTRERCSLFLLLLTISLYASIYFKLLLVIQVKARACYGHRIGMPTYQKY